ARGVPGPRLGRPPPFYPGPAEHPRPGTPEPAADGDAPRSDPFDGGARIDLTRLEQVSGAESEMLSRYLRMIQVQRQDFNGRVLTIRRDDMRAIACILGVDEESADRRLEEL